MNASERFKESNSRHETLKQQFSYLRAQTHASMERERQIKLKEEASPTDQEILQGAFDYTLEPQVRDAVHAMYRKGYATHTSGFYETQPDVQHVGGIFYLDDATTATLRRMCVEVLNGYQLGLPPPDGALLTILRFRCLKPDPMILQRQWAEVVAALPQKSLPNGVIAISADAEEFRTRHAPGHPTLAGQYERYLEYVRRDTQIQRR